ncbi:tRNA (N(6)-L-threonylcarbamoyladenosine(37)-C(2))-methylthiotransferase MtaB [Rickettsiales bacterium]|nr:tRNA (N(6)-L-threonylcarbamoyladenosine(37)-C(2))-methylthiotransferase MtaB [Rickettsiales bacterium]
MKNESSVINLGCRLNSYESEVISDILVKNNVKSTIVINTCAVTNNAVQKSKSEIRKAKKQNPKNKIIVTGCASHVDPKSFLDMNEVDEIIKNQFKTQKISYQNKLGNLVHEAKMKTSVFPEPLEKFNQKTRALLQIQQGCDHRCTFCIIPYGRGDSVSLPLSEIVTRTKKFLKAGYKEIIMTGVDITSYGNDLPGKPKLGEIIKRLLNMLPDLNRLRLSSIDPAEIDADLLDLITNEKKIMPHIHLSAQSGDNMILKRMKRRHNRTDLLNLCNYLKKKRPSITFGADIIVGFPTETEQNFQNTYECINQCNFSNLHIFPFSPKIGTPASKMPQVERKIINYRASQLRKLGSWIKLEIMKEKVGKINKILFEGSNLSYTDDYFKLSIPDLNKNQIKKMNGELIEVKFKSFNEKSLIAKVL